MSSRGQRTKNWSETAGDNKERPSEACLYQLLNVSELLTETVDYCNYLLREARKVRRKRLGEGGRGGAEGEVNIARK